MGNSWEKEPFPMEKAVLKLELTSNQRHLIRATWRDHEHSLCELSCLVYRHIFERSSDAKRLFPSLLACGDDWESSRDFRSLTIKFTQSLDEVVKSINDTHKLEIILKKVGAKHVKFAARGFSPDFWLHFPSGIRFAMSQLIHNCHSILEKEQEEALEAWNVLAHFIVTKMDEGYRQAEAKERPAVKKFSCRQ